MNTYIDMIDSAGQEWTRTERFIEVCQERDALLEDKRILIYLLSKRTEDLEIEGKTILDFYSHWMKTLEQANRKLKDILEQVEWVVHYSSESYAVPYSICPWCGSDIDDGHAASCVRQEALYGKNSKA